MQMQKRTVATWWVALFLVPGAAAAQFGDPEAGDTGGWTPPAAQQPSPTPAPPQQPPPPPPPPQQPQRPAWFQQDQERPPAMGGAAHHASEAGSSETDHAAVLDAIGIQYLGTQQVGFVTPQGSEFGGLGAAAAGLRFWLSEGAGLDAGLIFGYAKPEQYRGGDFVGNFSAYAFGLHFGVPLALQAYRHLTFLVVPEARVLFGGVSFLGQPEDRSEDWTSSSLLFSLGARVGTEIQFGFWDMPQLAIQMSVGLALQYLSQSAEMVVNRDINADNTQLQVRTFADDLFEGTVRVVYYLP